MGSTGRLVRKITESLGRDSTGLLLQPTELQPHGEDASLGHGTGVRPEQTAVSAVQDVLGEFADAQGDAARAQLVPLALGMLAIADRLDRLERELRELGL